MKYFYCVSRRFYFFLAFISLFSFIYLNSAIYKPSFAQTCATQPPVTGVSVEYPGINNGIASFITASCSWNAVAGATSYLVNVDELETSVAIKDNETVAANVTKVIFPITQNRTYKCDIVAVNSCGNQSTVASDQLLCAANGLVGSASPSVTQPATGVGGGGGSSSNPGIVDPGSTDVTLYIIGGIILVTFAGIVLIKK